MIDSIQQLIYYNNISCYNGIQIILTNRFIATFNGCQFFFTLITKIHIFWKCFILFVSK